MKKKTIFLLALSVLLITAITMNGTLAYFTSYAEAKGGHPIFLGDTHITEVFSNWTKRVTVSNDGQPVYVRARAFASNQYFLEYGTGTANDDPKYTCNYGNWTRNDDGYYYYDTILGPGEKTSELMVRINNIPESVADGDSFNVVVIYESTPVQYDEHGNQIEPKDADWNLIPDGGNEG